VLVDAVPTSEKRYIGKRSGSDSSQRKKDCNQKPHVHKQKKVLIKDATRKNCIVVVTQQV